MIADHKIYNDSIIDGLIVESSLAVPVVPNIAQSQPIAGGILYNPQSQLMYYSNGLIWLPIGGSTVTGASYSFVKNTPQLVPPSTNTQLSDWTISPSPAYSSLSDWDLVSGIFTSSSSCILTMCVDISWTPGNNRGNRSTQIEYMAFGSGVWQPIKKSVTQPDANSAVQTTQELSTVLKLNVGDKVRITSLQTSLTNTTIENGIQTTVSGIKLAA